jgi:membrane protease YdiL (CAAX protease family)
MRWTAAPFRRAPVSARCNFFTAMHDASGGASNSIGVLLAHWASLGLIPALLTFFGLAIANGGISEEAGWRGYMLAGLLPGRRVLTAAVLVGFFWGLWHTGPEFWAGILQSNWKVIAIPLDYTLGTIPLTIMIAWVFLNAKKSLLPGMLLHACYNGTFFFLTQIWTPQHPVVTIPEWLVASYAAALIVLVIGRRTLLAREVAELS